jgi:hypothetical protein
MATDHKRLFREGAAKVSGAIAQQMDSVYGVIANPEVITVGMMRDLGATDLGAGEGKTAVVDNRPVEKDSPELIAARKTGSLERVLRARRKPAVAQKLTRQEKMDKALAWAKTLTEDEREKFIVSDKFDALTDRQQEGISEAFGLIEDRAYEDSIGVANVDLDAELPDVDAIVGDEDDGPIDASDLSEADYAAIFEEAGWQGEQS